MSADPFDEALRVEVIARVCHEANRGWCAVAAGDYSQLAWQDAPDWQRESAREGVRFHLANLNAGPEASHDNWMQGKLADGWVYGAEKDYALKTHPCIRPFAELPAHQQAKDHLFRAIVHALAPVI